MLIKIKQGPGSKLTWNKKVESKTTEQITELKVFFLVNQTIISLSFSPLYIYIYIYIYNEHFLAVKIFLSFFFPFFMASEVKETIFYKTAMLLTLVQFTLYKYYK